MHKDPTCPFRHVPRWFSETHLRSLMFFRFYSVWPRVFPKIQAYSEHRKMRQYASGIGKPATLGGHEQTVPQSWKQFQELNFWEEPSQVRMGTVRDPCLWRSRVCCCRDKWQPGGWRTQRVWPQHGARASIPCVLSHWNYSLRAPSPQHLYVPPPDTLLLIDVSVEPFTSSNLHYLLLGKQWHHYSLFWSLPKERGRVSWLLAPCGAQLVGCLIPSSPAQLKNIAPETLAAMSQHSSPRSNVLLNPKKNPQLLSSCPQLVQEPQPVYQEDLSARRKSKRGEQRNWGPVLDKRPAISEVPGIQGFCFAIQPESLYAVFPSPLESTPPSLLYL